MMNKPSAEELKKIVRDAVLRRRISGTEPPFTGRLLHNKRDGVYHCLILRCPAVSFPNKV